MELDSKFNILNSQKLSDLDREGTLIIVRIAHLKRFAGVDIQIDKEARNAYGNLGENPVVKKSLGR
jgi:hypothetical protein